MQHVLGVLLAIFSALAFSSSDVAIRRGVVRAPVSHGAFVTVMLGVPLFALAALVSGQMLRVDDLTGASYGLLAAAGIVHYVVGRYFNYAAIEAIGAARSGPVQALGLPYSVAIALLFLDEEITLGMAIGIALIVVGPLVMIERRGAVRTTAPARSTSSGPAVALGEKSQGLPLRQVEGYLFAVIAAISYGSSPVFIRAALEGESGLSVLGGFVSYLAAAALLLATLVIPSRRSLIGALNPSSARLFFVAGFFVFLAQLLRFVALSLAPVALVTTLLRFTGIFTLALSWVLNRSLEYITLRTVAAILISVAGAVLLVVTRAD
ncbi:MAG TPA: DMT family transporter [Dehalococcoidia bacterium]|nr:DMT family transporter [Dehalococcoidia bacterium]